MSLAGFCRLFYLDNGEIVANKKERWYNFLRAAANGRLLERPNVAPLWQPRKLYQPQMPDRLQSGYADVEHELVVMSKLAREHNIAVLFVAGDGLALMRLNHLLKSKRDIYMDMAPVIIPIQGAPRVLSASVFRLGFLCAAVSYVCCAHVLQVSIRMGSST